MKRVGMVSLQGEWSLSGVCFLVWSWMLVFMAGRGGGFCGCKGVMFRGSAPLYKACWSFFFTCTWSFMPWLVSAAQLPVLVLVLFFCYISGGGHWINYLCQSFVMLHLLWSFSLHCPSVENSLCCGSLAFSVLCSVFKPTSAHSWWYKILVWINSCLMILGGELLCSLVLFVCFSNTITSLVALKSWLIGTACKVFFHSCVFIF